MHSTVLAPFTASDGENLAVYEWPLDAWFAARSSTAEQPRAIVLIVHGLGEHAMRYEALAFKLLHGGFAVRAYDQRGHGNSGGAQGVLPSDEALLDDLADMVDDTRLYAMRLQAELAADATQPGAAVGPIPLIVLGHSLGGLVASCFVARNIRPVDGLILSSPALDAGLSVVQKLMLKVMPNIAPDFCIGNGLDARFLSHDDTVVARYRADRLVHDRISSRLGRFIAESGPQVIAAAPSWHTRTLLMYAGDDRLVNPAGSHAFAEAAGAPAGSAATQGLVTSRCFDGLYHELFNEKDSQPVFDTLHAWLDAYFQ